MKRFVKSISLLLAILTVLPCIPVFAADLSESVSLVENGLAAHYDASNNTGDGHDATAEVLADLAGENDIALTLSESVSFTKDALRISAAQVEFPEAILDIVNGSEFTVEMKVGTIAAIGSEAGWKWAVGAVLYDTALAWGVAWVVYHVVGWLM